MKIEAEKPLQGFDMKNHGIRMDLCIMEYEGDMIASVYDIEPNKYDVSELPKRSRYSQALTDARLLESGKRYAMLPEYISIWILTVDPFGKNQMVYTIKNKVENYPDIAYNDGVTKLFLYVDGDAGGNTNLKELLQFFKNSRKTETADAEMKLLQELLEDVKRSPEERKRYMTWQDYIEYEKEDARKEAFNEGVVLGITALVNTLQEMKLPENEIVEKLVSKFQLTEEKAREYLAGNQ